MKQPCSTCSDTARSTDATTLNFSPVRCTFTKHQTTMLPPPVTVLPARDNTFRETFSHSTHTPSNSHTEAHVGQAENTSWFLAYTAGITTEIVSITPTRSVPMKCVRWTVLHNLYLAGHNLIPTHNSFLAFLSPTRWRCRESGQSILTRTDAKPMGDLSGLGSPRVFDLRHGNDGRSLTRSLRREPFRI